MSREEKVEQVKRMLGTICWTDFDTSDSLRSITYAMLSDDVSIVRKLGIVKEDVEALINRLTNVVRNIDERINELREN